MKTFKIDYFEECIGTSGIWQIATSFIAILARYIALANITSIVFLTPNTEFTCVEFLDNRSITTQNNTCYHNCSKYVYHSAAMKTTLISDFGLICENKWMANFTQTSLMFGVLFGVMFFGWFSDRYGRRIAIISSTFLNVITMIPTSFAPNYWTFNVLRFVTGLASGGSLIVVLTLLVEVSSIGYREYASALTLLADGFGEAFLALYAYALPNWNIFLLGLSMAATLILIVVCFLPESPRWLISHGKVDEALTIIIGAAKLNKLNTEHIRDTIVKGVELMNIKESKKLPVSYIDLFKEKTSIYRNMSISMVWFVIGTTFNGLNQYMTFLGNNVHVIVIILGLAQVLLCGVQCLLTKISKRKTSLIISLLITGLTMCAFIFMPQEHWSSILLGVIGFSASSISFGVIGLYQSELIPTPMRNTSLGLGSAAAKIGAMLAPFIATLTPVWVPSLIFSLFSIIAAGLCLLLPETKGNRLKDTIY